MLVGVHAEANLAPVPSSSMSSSPSGAADDAETSILDPHNLSTLFSDDYANNSLQASAFMRAEVSCRVLAAICAILHSARCQVYKVSKILCF